MTDGCPHLDYRHTDGEREFDEPRAYCTVADRFVQPMRADVCNERYDLSPARHCEIYREHEGIEDPYLADRDRGGWDGDATPRGTAGTYEAYLDGRPVVVTAALTGGIHGKEASSALPETPEEVAAAARECEAAGASVVHLHARRDNGERAFSRERFQELTDAVRAATDDVVVQHSTGGSGVPVEKRRQSLRTDPPPEMASLDMGPLNRYRHLTAENTRATIDSLAAEMADREIVPEIEAFNSGQVTETYRLLEEGPIDDPPYVNLIFGGGTLTPPSPGNLLDAVDDLPATAEFNVLGFGPHQLPMTTTSMLVGGHVRVGLEDNLYYRKGELADSNAQLVERTVRVAEELGRPVASPDQARSILGIE